MPSRGCPVSLREAIPAALIAAVAVASVSCRPGAAVADAATTAPTAAPARPGAAAVGDAATPARAAPGVPPLPPGCAGPATAKDGRRALALLVGVGEYAAVDRLVGPRNDVDAMRRLLVDQYGFPAENVCVLVDREATTAAFRAAFERALVARAQPGDLAVFMFAGHGSQVPDENGDEPDGWDETLLLQDARTPGVADLVDDELNGMLERLYARTENVTVIVDACSSGTVTRGVAAGTARARFQPPAGAKAPRPAGPTGGLADPFVPATLSRAVVLTAAADGTSALEVDGHGVFTSALVQVLSEPARDPLTWAAVARRVPGLVKVSSLQQPYFQGDLDRQVLGAGTRPRPPSWELKAVGPAVDLAGPPLPGMGVGAELRVFAPGLRPADYADPARAKGLLVVRSFTGLEARAAFTARPGAPAPRPGDLALLVRPGDDALRLSVRIRPLVAGEGGIDADTARRIRAAVEADDDARASVVLADGPGAFELSRAGEALVLRGPEDHVRNVYASVAEIPRSLWQHARQRALLALRPEGGDDFVAEESLQMELVPAAARYQDACGRRAAAEWVQAAPNSEQVVPLCAVWQLRVALRRSATRAVRVGGVILSSDGSTLAFPESGAALLLQPGEELVVPDVTRALPPLDTIDTVRVFGTQESNPVDWRVLTETARRRAALAGARGPLQRLLDRYVTVGARGQGRVTAPVDETTWTASSLTVRVEANARFAAPSGEGAPPTAREYTIRDFDLRPYRGADPASPLDRVLAQADALARTQVGYRQHPWAAATDAENLQRGIDCSRAIWFAFTRAGLRYSRRSPEGARPPGFAKDYLTTAEMVAEGTPMADLFEPCAPADPRLGDLLVYRDDVKGDGHVVMVIDPARRIAWGSHGWDGSAKELKLEPATGVEYQRIKHKPDWERWDRKDMTAKACWRYRAFAADAGAPRGLALAAERDPCNAARCPRKKPQVASGDR
jgi:hypothetical protein